MCIRPARPIFSLSLALRAIIVFIFVYKLSVFFTSHRKPLTPSMTASLHPAILLVMTGLPLAAHSVILTVSAKDIQSTVNAIWSETFHSGKEFIYSFFRHNASNEKEFEYSVIFRIRNHSKCFKVDACSMHQTGSVRFYNSFPDEQRSVFAVFKKHGSCTLQSDFINAHDHSL